MASSISKRCCICVENLAAGVQLQPAGCLSAVCCTNVAALSCVASIRATLHSPHTLFHSWVPARTDPVAAARQRRPLRRFFLRPGGRDPRGPAAVVSPRSRPFDAGSPGDAILTMTLQQQHASSLFRLTAHWNCNWVRPHAVGGLAWH
jgi:hypothetical protein